MSHFVRTRPDPPTGPGWYSGYLVSGADMRDLDEKTSHALSAVGQTWTPTAPIILTAAGLIDPTDPVLVIGTTATLGSGSSITTSPGNHVVLGRGDSSDYVQPAISSARTLFTHLSDTITNEPFDVEFLNGVAGAGHSGALRPLRLQGVYSAELRVHDRFSVLTVDFWFIAYASVHSGLPGALPRFRVIRVGPDGVVALQGGAGVDASGWLVLPTPANVAAYENGGAAQSITYTCNQNNLIDVSQYSYFAQVQASSDVGATDPTGEQVHSWDGNGYIAAVATTDVITQLSPQ